jgi:voltage-gated potassium channel
MMFVLIQRFCRHALFRLYENTWVVIVISIAMLYAGGWLSMSAFNETDIIDNYTWWFSVTITTVGYGDYAPGSYGGRFTAGVIMFFGIGIIGLVVGKLAETIIEIANRKVKGLSHMNYENHTIIMGYRTGSTEKMITELLADNPEQKIVLCSLTQESNPMVKQKVDFIRGELASTDVLTRSNAAKARNIIIHGKDDDQTFFTAYALREINRQAHMVCCLMDEDHADKIKKLPADDPSLNQIVLPANIYLMAQELQDRESCSVVQNLISNLTGQNMYRLDIPKQENFSVSYKSLFFALKEKYGVTVIAVKDKELEINPPLDMTIKPGMAVFYAGPERLSFIELDAIQEAV